MKAQIIFGIQNIELLRRKLNTQIKLNDSYENILTTSKKLDSLMNCYYTYVINV